MKKLIEHADAIGVVFTIMVTIFGAGLWMNAQFNHIDQRFASMENKFESRFSAIEKDIAIIKTVLIIKEIMPNELAKDDSCGF